MTSLQEYKKEKKNKGELLTAVKFAPRILYIYNEDAEPIIVDLNICCCV